MNCPSRTGGIVEDGVNQSPPPFAPDLTTRSDFGPIANARLQRDHRVGIGEETDAEVLASQQHSKGPDKTATATMKSDEVAQERERPGCATFVHLT